MTEQLIDPTTAVAELGRIKLGETDLNGILARIAELAGRSLSGAEQVSVTLVTGEGAHTAAFTGEMALLLDEWQYDRDRGPCLEASRTAATVSIPDMAAERRWLDWSTNAFSVGARSSLSIGLPVEDTVTGALNIYGITPHAFDDETITLAQAFASYAAVALANAHLYDTTATLAQQMQTAMEHRAVIEQAKGIIMGERRCTAEDAFALLVKVSQDANRKVRDVAAALVDQARQTPGR